MYEKVIIRIDLKQEELEYFNALKENMVKTGQKTNEKVANTTVIREALRIASNQITTTHAEVRDEYITEINRLLKSPIFRRTYAISNINQFIDKALSDFFEAINKNKQSLKSDTYEVLSQLNPIERAVAMAILELNQKSNQITFNDIVAHLERDKELIIKALDSLIVNGFVEKMEYRGQELYWVL